MVDLDLRVEATQAQIDGAASRLGINTAVETAADVYLEHFKRVCPRGEENCGLGVNPVDGGVVVACNPELCAGPENITKLGQTLMRAFHPEWSTAKVDEAIDYALPLPKQVEEDEEVRLKTISCNNILDRAITYHEVKGAYRDPISCIDVEVIEIAGDQITYQVDGITITRTLEAQTPHIETEHGNAPAHLAALCEQHVLTPREAWAISDLFTSSDDLMAAVHTLSNGSERDSRLDEYLERLMGYDGGDVE